MFYAEGTVLKRIDVEIVVVRRSSDLFQDDGRRAAASVADTRHSDVALLLLQDVNRC